MVPRKRLLTHPGAVLRKEFLLPSGMSQTRLAAKLHISTAWLNRVLNGRGSITASLAWKLALEFDTTAELWMNLQSGYDLARHRPRHLKRVPGVRIRLSPAGSEAVTVTRG